MPVKTDRNDARAIAQVVRTGWFRAVHVKSGTLSELRALLTARKLLVAKLRDLDSGIRGLLRGFGLKVGQVGERSFPSRIQELVQGLSLEAVVGPLLQARSALIAERDHLHGLVIAAARRDEAANVLLTRTSRWSALKAWGLSVAKRAGMRRAKVAVARKLATAC
jgi:transposase